MKKILTICLLGVLIVGAVALLQKRKRELAQSPMAQVLPVVVDTIRLTQAPILLTLPAMGLVGSDLSASLSTKVSGQVLAVYKQEGDVVAKGDLLARIDISDLEAKRRGLELQRQGIQFQIDARREDIKAARTALAAARETHARTEQLLRIKGASVEQSRQEEAEVARLEASLSAAENGVATLEKSRQTLEEGMREIDSLIGYATITSPIAGTVSASLVKPGDLAMPGKPLFRIAARAGLYMDISLPDTLHATEVIFRDRTLRLAPKGQAGTTGLVQYVAPIPDASGVVEGQYVDVRLVVYRGSNVLVPVDALLTMDQRSFVFALAGGKAEKIPVHVLVRGAEGVILRENLAGRRVIIAKPDILLRVATGAPVAEIKAE